MRSFLLKAMRGASHTICILVLIVAVANPALLPYVLKLFVIAFALNVIFLAAPVLMRGRGGRS